ncbi:hypothetical protein ACJZ2D_001270 [Fusarium nematophilum]
MTQAESIPSSLPTSDSLPPLHRPRNRPTPTSKHCLPRLPPAMLASPAPRRLLPLSPPQGWPKCTFTDFEPVTYYNRFVEQWNSWAKTKFPDQELCLIGKTTLDEMNWAHVVAFHILWGQETLKKSAFGKRAQGKFPLSDVTKLLYNENGPVISTPDQPAALRNEPVLAPPPYPMTTHLFTERATMCLEAVTIRARQLRTGHLRLPNSASRARMSAVSLALTVMERDSGIIPKLRIHLQGRMHLEYDAVQSLIGDDEARLPLADA